MYGICRWCCSICTVQSLFYTLSTNPQIKWIPWPTWFFNYSCPLGHLLLPRQADRCSYIQYWSLLIWNYKVEYFYYSIFMMYWETINSKPCWTTNNYGGLHGLLLKNKLAGQLYVLWILYLRHSTVCLIGKLWFLYYALWCRLWLGKWTYMNCDYEDILKYIPKAKNRPLSLNFPGMLFCEIWNCCSLLLLYEGIVPGLSISC